MYENNDCLYVLLFLAGKRHHTRFFPTEAANADQNGNPKAGTVVDRGGMYVCLPIGIPLTQIIYSHCCIRFRFLPPSAWWFARNDSPNTLLCRLGRD